MPPRNLSMLSVSAVNKLSDATKEEETQTPGLPRPGVCHIPSTTPTAPPPLLPQRPPVVGVQDPVTFDRFTAHYITNGVRTRLVNPHARRAARFRVRTRASHCLHCVKMIPGDA